MKKKDVMKKKPEELDNLLKDLKKDLFNSKSTSLAGEDSVQKKARVKIVKRDIARVLTRLNSK